MDIPTKFTQEIKDNWLKALKSGKYKQGFTGLVVDENNEEVVHDDTMKEKFFCCLGVLGDCTPGLMNSLEEKDIDVNPYGFLKNTIGNELKTKLYVENDDWTYRVTGKRDYSNVIPLIESLPVQNQNLNIMETETQARPKIENAKQILDIIAPIPAERFIVGDFGIGEAADGPSCFLGHIHRALSPKGPTDYDGDYDGFGARRLTRKFLNEKHGLIGQDGADVNNYPEVNGYTEPVIKDRIMHMLNDMVEAGY